MAEEILCILEDVSEIPSETLAEEKEADEIPTDMAQSNINYAAGTEGEESQEA